MSAITPSNLLLQNVGSMTLHIADMNTASGGDIWESSITNIVSAFAVGRDAITQSGSAIGWTESSGTINFLVGDGGGRITAWILSGFANK